jgi:hypothetical protein
MALFLGSNQRLKIIMDGVVYRINIPAPKPISNLIRLKSLDNYALKDSNGLYLTVKLEETPSQPDTSLIRLMSSDNYTLKDLDGLYLTVEEIE